jgi:SAM-dependent methyltransferase
MAAQDRIRLIDLLREAPLRRGFLSSGDRLVASAAVGTEVKHPLFARFFDRLSRMLEPELGPRREELLAGLSGRVLEVGAGNGINFAHYPASVDEVVALEPEPYMRAKATLAAGSAAVPVTVSAGVAEELRFPDGSFDAVIACLVLCSVSDLACSLAGLARVLRPGGELRFLEHVRAGGGPKAGVQSALDRSHLWPLLGGGCHCARDTVGAIRAAGFAVTSVRQLSVGPSWGWTNPHVLGVAVGSSP